MKSRLFTLFILVLTTIIIISCGDSKPKVDKMAIAQKAKSVFSILPKIMPGSENDTPELIELGKKLYFDNRLSVNNEQSCNTCHLLDEGIAGVDNLPTSPGAKKGTIGTRNSPTVLNAGFQFVQFWDGRAADLKEQAMGPILNPIEMGIPDSNVAVKKIGAVDEYKEMFEKVNMKITYSNIAEAIAAFERTLITIDRFDMFLKGNPKALTEEEVLGLDLFMEKGCITCHIGPLLGGNIYQKAGLIKPYPDTTDTGRFEVTGKESDKFMFKVPMLRNVALTGPYFHDGKTSDLKKAIILMADIQLGKTFTDDEADKIVKFLESLTDINLAKLNPKK